MKKIIICLLFVGLAACLTAAPSLAGGYALDEDALIPGMERSWAQGYAPTVSGGTLSICLPVAARQDGEKMTATLVTDQLTLSPFKSQKMSVTVAARDGVFPVRLRLKLLADYESGDYPCSIRLDGPDGPDELSLLLKLRGGQPGGETARVATGQVGAQLTAGETGVIRALVSNPCAHTALCDVRLTLSDLTGGVLPQASNTVYLGDLAPGRQTQVEIPVTVLPDADATVHSIRFDYAFSALGEERAFSEVFSLSVTQPIRLEHGALDMPQSVVQNDMVSLALPLMNMGRGRVVNALIRLNMPGAADGTSVLLGALEPGETKNARLTFAPDPQAVGPVEGTLFVSCEDEWGNQSGFELPLALTVEQAAPPPQQQSGRTAGPDAGSPRALLIALASACLALTAALIVQGALLRARLRRAEEAKL